MPLHLPGPTRRQVPPAPPLAVHRRTPIRKPVVDQVQVSAQAQASPLLRPQGPILDLDQPLLSSPRALLVVV